MPWCVFLFYGFLFLTSVWVFSPSVACSLDEIRSGGGSQIFGIWSPSEFPPSMYCGGRWKSLPSSSSLFVSVFDRSAEEEDYEVSVFTVRVVMSLMVLISSEALISLTSLASINLSCNRATHFILFSNFLD